MGFFLLSNESPPFALETVVVGPVRLNNGISGLLGASAAVRYAPGAVRLGAEEGLLVSGFLNPGLSNAPRDDSQLGSPAQSGCAEGREMLSAEHKKYVPGGGLQKVRAGQGEEKGEFLFCFVF